MNDFSVLIGGQAGYGIDKSSLILANILTQQGYRIFIHRDYPSLIRGGHTFSIIRAAKERIAAHSNKVDFLLALNQDTIDFHQDKLQPKTTVVYDSDSVKSTGLGVAIGQIIKEEKASEIMRNACIVGAFCEIAGIDWEILETVFKKDLNKEIEANLKIARRGFDAVNKVVVVEKIDQNPLPFLTGNEAIGLGLIQAGLKAYVAYPMTPSSTILSYLADAAEKNFLKVLQPESEIGVMLMALGFSYAGEKTAVGTSGGGFCLMTEGLSFAGMAELPITIILGQRPGPSTGLPTYSSQTELHFALNAGQGEFPRFIVAPGDAEEAYYWSAFALNIAWQYQIPSIILTDKTVAEGTYNFDINTIGPVKNEPPASWEGKVDYKRYRITDSGVSPLAFPSNGNAIVKINSYEHDEAGITTEDPAVTKLMQEKRLRKEKLLSDELDKIETIKVYGNKGSTTALLCWGSNKGVCLELALKLNLKLIYPLVLAPFSTRQFKDAVSGVKKLVCIENNATGQLARLISQYGFAVDEKILKYDGRPFTLDELENKLTEVIK